MELKKSLYFEIFNTIQFEKTIEHPNILIAANFWESERYLAAKTCYKFLRVIDDLIDGHKTIHAEIVENEKLQFATEVDAWMKSIVESDPCNSMKLELIETIEKFKLPLWPFEAFAKSMIYDIYHDGFQTVNDFIDYSGGASVAPASIFVHLCGLSKLNDDFLEPCFDLKEIATPCAIFSYLVHIMRDFQKDQLNHLNYFADDVLANNKLTREDLQNIARGSSINQGFRNMMLDYIALAECYRQKTQKIIKEIRQCLDSRYQLSLEIIFNLYQMAFKKIDPLRGNFTTRELNPTSQETKNAVYDTILNFTA